jgi:nuclear pore complex protein Nup62
VRKVRALWVSELFAGLLLIVLALNISGCGSVGSAPSNPSPSGNATIAITQAPPSTLAANGTAAISATVTNDSTNSGVDWSCAPAASCGTFNPAHTASGATTTFTAPSAATTVTITAASTHTHTATAVATVTVTGGSTTVGISITTAPPATLQVNGTSSI